MTKVSILIPNYNQEGLIGLAVKSALEIDWPNFEVIVCDDESTDNSLWELKKFESDKRLRVVKNRINLGRIANHKYLLDDLAKGDFVLMLDGDDYLCSKDYVRQAVKMAEENNLDFIFSEAKILDHQTREISISRFSLEKTGIYNYMDIFHRNVLFMHGAVLYRRQPAIEENFYSREVIADDNESFLRFILGRRVGFIKKPTYIYRTNINPEGLGYNIKLLVKNNDLIASVITAAKKLNLPAVETRELQKWGKRQRSGFFYEAVLNFLKTGRFGYLFQFKLEYLRREGFGKFIGAAIYPFFTKELYAKLYSKIKEKLQ